MLILTWIGAVLALALMLVMALGPAIVEIDARLYERKRRRAAERAPADHVRPQPGRVAQVTGTATRSFTGPTTTGAGGPGDALGAA